MSCSALSAASSRRATCSVAFTQASRSVARRPLTCRASKGFGTDSKVQPEQGITSANEESSTVEALESQIRGKKGKKGGKIEPQVKVVSPVVDAVTGKKPVTAAERAETAVVLGLFYFFIAIMLEGLLLAGSGFLPEDIDQYIQDHIYPSYSPTVILFLGCSSLYGLFKTGKLPGQKQL